MNEKTTDRNEIVYFPHVRQRLYSDTNTNRWDPGQCFIQTSNKWLVFSGRQNT